MRLSYSKSLALLVGGYFLIEIFLIPNILLAYDEFWFAQHIYQYTKQLPYRDFLPYKTVLGYYLLSLPMWFSHALFTPIFLIKSEIALLNTLVLLVIGFYSRRFFNKKAILLTLALIISNQLFLFYSVELRVDMLSSWLGLIAVLAILYRHHRLAGLLIGVSFLFSQKGLWFYLAINSAYFTTLLIKNLRKETLHTIILFNLTSLLSLTLYLAFWCFITEPSTVFHSVFYEAYTQAKITWYSQAYVIYWQMIFANGPLLIGLIPLTWLTLIFLGPTWNRLFITTFNAVMMILLISYQQAFPYNMVFAVPVFFLAYADFFSGLLWLRSSSQTILPSYKLILFLSVYTLALLLIIIFLKSVFPYGLMILIPICLALYIVKPHATFLYLTAITILFTGFMYPLIRMLDQTQMTLNGYQKFTVALAEDLLKDKGGYVAGSPLIYYKPQPILGLENLISPAIAYLYTSSPKLLPIMISSLNLTPMTQPEVIQSLATSSVKLYVNNNRILNLPPAILNYLHSEYSHYWASIYIYSPSIKKDQTEFFVKFSNLYRVVAPKNSHIFIDHKSVEPDSIVSLNRDYHYSKADTSYRLKLIPTNQTLTLLPEYEHDTWQIAAK